MAEASVTNDWMARVCERERETALKSSLSSSWKCQLSFTDHTVESRTRTACLGWMRSFQKLQTHLCWVHYAPLNCTENLSKLKKTPFLIWTSPLTEINFIKEQVTAPKVSVKVNYEFIRAEGTSKGSNKCWH